LTTKTGGFDRVHQGLALILLLECHVAGTAYCDLDAIEDALRAGGELAPRREPGNEHDPLAIQILTAGGTLLGYVPRA
jgi:hypothetical protein